MVVERRITPEDSAALAQQLRDAFRSLEESVSFDWMGQSMVLERVSDVEFVVRQPSGGDTNRVVLGADARPPGYPGGLPYIPGEVVMFSTSALAQAATWWITSDQSTLFADLEHRCLEAGWERQSEPAMSDAEVTRCTYRKVGAMRHLMLSQGIVSLVERPVGKPSR